MGLPQTSGGGCFFPFCPPPWTFSSPALSHRHFSFVFGTLPLFRQLWQASPAFTYTTISPFLFFFLLFIWLCPSVFRFPRFLLPRPSTGSYTFFQAYPRVVPVFLVKRFLPPWHADPVFCPRRPPYHGVFFFFFPRIFYSYSADALPQPPYLTLLSPGPQHWAKAFFQIVLVAF